MLSLLHIEDIAVISLGGTVVNTSLKLAGDGCLADCPP